MSPLVIISLQVPHSGIEFCIFPPFLYFLSEKEMNVVLHSCLTAALVILTPVGPQPEEGSGGSWCDEHD